MKKRTFIMRKLRHWLYSLLQEEQEEQDIHEAAQLWHRMAKPCERCAKPVSCDSLFCPHCTYPQSRPMQTQPDRQTSGVQLPISQYSPVTIGSHIIAYKMPDERPLKAYLRLRSFIDERRKKQA